MVARKVAVFLAATFISVGIAAATDTRATWNANCASCHGKDGSGGTAMGRKLNTKDYRDPKVQAVFSDAEAERAIKEGVKTNGKETMKPFGGKIPDAEIKALVAYIRAFKK